MVVRLRAVFCLIFPNVFFSRCATVAAWNGLVVVWCAFGWWKNMLLEDGRICLGWWKNMVWCDLGAFNCCVVEWKNMLVGGGKNMVCCWVVEWKNMPLNGRTCSGWKKMLLVVEEEAHFGYKIVFNAKWWMLDQNMDHNFYGASSEIADHQFEPAPVIDTNDSEFKTPPMAPLQQGLQQDITTRRNRPKYLYEGALYVYHGMSSKKDAKYWRCEFFNARDIKCRGRLHTDLNDVVIRQIGDHVCNHNAARVEAQRILSGIKRRAMVTTEKPLQIRNQTLQNTPMAVVAAMPSKEATKRMIKRARRGIDMNTLLNPHACPIFKQDNGDHYMPGNMVYTEIDGQRVESFEHIPSDFSKGDGIEEKWPRVGGTYGGGGTPQMGSSTNPHGTIGGVDGYPNNRQETKTGAGRPRKKVKQEYLLPPPQPIAILDRTLPHVFVNRKTNEFSFSCNIAGYTPEELQVELVGAELVISGAHKQQTINQSFTASFSRRILLPEGVHKETIQCSVDDKGLLNVSGQLMHVGKPKTIQQEYNSKCNDSNYKINNNYRSSIYTKNNS
uniref:SHSP domain-containing protein n=1 Tax=Meloidogyne enterolobii TaxID=390850 RepID=A0A6V7V0I4_MELEN|nr:unnamed protein product [Meloidogyne enterolobii]